MPTQEQKQRLERIIERLQEDERLRGDLQDSAAQSLLEWAIAQVSAAAQKGESELQEAVRNVRQAAVKAASSGLSEPEQIIAVANRALSTSPEQGLVALSPAPIVLAEPHNDEKAS